MGELITVVIADDHPYARVGIKASLEEARLDGARFEVVAEAADTASAVEAARRYRPQVCLLDVNMPGSGIDACDRVHRLDPSIAIVMLTVSADDEHLFAALRAGASGYLLKDTSATRLPVALLGVLNGEAAVPRSLVARLISEFQGSTRRRLALRGRKAGVSLTTREWEVLELLDDGFTTAEVASRLGMAPVTVRSHVASVVKKLQVPDRASALRLLAD